MDNMSMSNDSFQEARKKSHFSSPFLMGGVVLLIVALLGVSIYFYLQYQNSQNLLKNPESASQSEVNSLVEKVGKHYDLPKNDSVTVATVSDINKLEGQVFFSKAQNGDKVLIYPKTSIAILYRPSTDKIINVGPVNTQSEAAIPSTSPPSTQSVKIALYNGTKTTGLSNQVEERLKALSSIRAEVVTKGNSSKEYAGSLVIDLTGKNAQAAQQMAAFTEGRVAQLPVGEVKPDGADIVIILGSSYVSSLTPTP
jgi:hypothetical protein